MASAQVRTIPLAVNDRIPLGIENFRLQPQRQEFYLMASAEAPMFLGMRRLTAADHRRDQLIDGQGKPVRFYPRRVNFRVTASSREKILDERPWNIESKYSLSELLMKFHFRAKIFHGLDYWYVEPLFVQNVGMPADLPYNERIYRIGFDLGRVPIDDRIVIEVLEPSGKRLCKFHLDIL
jgi:hypothetical protein